MAPTVGSRELSTYTVLGLTGFLVASMAASVIMWCWKLALLDRLIATLIPPLAFLGVVLLVRRIVGHERIVFYQTASAAIIAVAGTSALAGAHTMRLIDVATIGIGIFLVFGRLGCHAVACCHGRPARYGVAYGPAHVRIGFWARWSGRRLWPVQLAESAISLVLVIMGVVVGWHTRGLPALIYIVGYGLSRFVLELRRGDAARPHLLGISEAQWTALGTLIACAIWQPNPVTIASALVLALSVLVLARLHRRRALLQPAHLREVDRTCRELLAGRPDERCETSLGVGISCHRLPDGRRDWIFSATHPAWSVPVARRLAESLWTQFEFVQGRLEGVAHVIERI